MAEDNEDGNIGSFYMGRVRPPPEPKRLLPPGALTLIALAVLGGIVWYAYPRGARNADVPVIKANTAPIKSTPANPGGMTIPFQHSTAFDPLTQSNVDTTEKLTPPPAQPVDKTAAIKALQAKMSAPAKMDMQVKQVGHGVEELVPPTPQERPAVTVASVAPHKVKSVKPVSAAQPQAAHKVAVVKKVVVNKVVVNKVPVRKTVASKAPAHEMALSVAGGDQFEVQLGSYRDRAGAKTYWTRTRSKFSSVLSHLDMRIVRADIAGKGTYYRLRAGPVTKDHGNAICDALKAARRPCILARR